MRNLLTFILLALTVGAIAQPANDDCQGSVLINTPDNYCSAIDEFTNVAATLSAGFGVPATCTPPWNGDQRDVWFTFVTPLGGSGNYIIDINGNTMMQPQVAVYRGSCPVLAEYACESAPTGSANVSLTVTGLDPGVQYWIRVNDWEGAGGTNEGDFQICIEEFFPPVNMINGMTTACSGTIYDSGGPNANYGPNEALAYSICPNDPHACLVLDFMTYDIETNSDFLTVHDGPDVLSPVIGQLTGVGGNLTLETNGGCLTLSFNSDATINSAGWVATWNCTTNPCSPDGSGINPPDLVDCTGDIFDSGLDTTGYLNNENWNYSICPNVPNGCIILTLDNYDTEAGIDILTFYDGPDIFSPVIDQISGSGAGATIIASSGCLTVGFTSNFLLQGDGWSGSWECTVDPCPIPTSIDVTVGVPDSVLIDNISSPEVVVSNVSLTCDGLAYGVFDVPGLSQIGIQKGIILASGQAADAQGPNLAGGTGTDLGQPGDASLDAQLVTFTTQDACALEFDVYAATNQISFNYVFASEEYPEFAPPQGSIFNDAFGFFISGPGIVGEKNIALIPNTTLPVSINNVNAVTNVQYYTDNAQGVTTEYDAFTTVLQAQTTVIPCDTYHLKLVIADVGDGVWDSGVFIEAGSLSSGVASIVPTFEFSPDLDYTIEGCAEGSITIELDQPQSDTTVIYLNPVGTATNGIDYNLLPDSLVFLPGVTSINVPFSPGFDQDIEGIEEAVIYLQQVTSCGTFVYDSAVVEIHDAVEIEFGLGASSGDTLSICKGDSISLEAYGGIDFLWTPNMGINDNTIYNPTVSPETSTWYVLTAGVSSCNDIDSLFIEVIDLQIDIPLGDTIGVCETASLIQLLSDPNIPGGVYAWTPGELIVDSTLQNPPVMPDTTTTFYVNYFQDGCPAVDSIVVEVANGVPINVISDTTICLGQGVVLGTTPNGGATYLWDPPTDLSNPNVANPLAIPSQTTTYTLTGSDGSGNCITMESVTITVSPGITVDAGPDQSICDGQSVQLTATTPDSGEYLWVPSATLSDPFIADPVATPEETTTYYVYLTDGPCETIDSMTVTVNSGAGITVAPDQTICVGDAVSIGGPAVTGVTYTWTPSTGLDDPNAANPNASPTATTTYTIVANTTSNCTSMEMVTVQVLDIPSVSASDDVTICEGETISISASGANGTTYTWAPSAGLSCVNCPAPNATPSATTTYYVEHSNGVCSDIDSVTVIVNGSFQLSVDPSNATIAQGDTALLTAIETASGSNPIGNITYVWTPNSGILATSANTVIVSPSETTTYTVTGTSDAGCSGSSSAIVEVIPPNYGVPNAFSPNGDNLNDYFTLEYSGRIEIEEFRIFDRWGQLVYNNQDPLGWDGKFESEELPQDVYIYQFILLLPDNTTETLTGDVTLLR